MYFWVLSYLYQKLTLIVLPALRIKASDNLRLREGWNSSSKSEERMPSAKTWICFNLYCLSWRPIECPYSYKKWYKFIVPVHYFIMSSLWKILVDFIQEQDVFVKHNALDNGQFQQRPRSQGQIPYNWIFLRGAIFCEILRLSLHRKKFNRKK